MYVLKTAALRGLAADDEIEVVEYPYYGGGAIKVGDEAFLWFSGTDQGLAWYAEVLRVEPSSDGKIAVTVRLIARAIPDALALADLASVRDSLDGSALCELSRKFYRHAHDKVAALSEEEAAHLRRYFSLRPTMSNPERIYTFLRQHTPAPICDDCVAKQAEVEPRQQVNPIASALGLTTDFVRAKGTCSICKGEKLVTRSLRYA